MSNNNNIGKNNNKESKHYDNEGIHYYSDYCLWLECCCCFCCKLLAPKKRLNGIVSQTKLKTAFSTKFIHMCVRAGGWIHKDFKFYTILYCGCCCCCFVEDNILLLVNLNANVKIMQQLQLKLQFRSFVTESLSATCGTGTV